MKTGIAVGVVIAIITLVVCLVPLKEVAHTVTVDYQDTETYYEDEPHETQVAVPLQYEVSILEDWDGWTYEDYEDYIRWQIYEKGYISHSNWDFSKELRFVPAISVIVAGDTEARGEYDIYFTFYFVVRGVWEYLSREMDEDNIKKYGTSLSYHKRMHIDAGWDDHVTFFAVAIDAESDKWTYDYRVEPGTKMVTETEYREVEKQRTVTKQRPETRYKKVTLLDYLLHY